MIESLHCRRHHHHHPRRRRRNQNHGFFKSKLLRVTHYEMQDVIGPFSINLVIPRIIVLSVANFESNFFPFFPQLFYLPFSHSYIFILHLYLSFFCDTEISFVVWQSEP